MPQRARWWRQPNGASASHGASHVSRTLWTSPIHPDASSACSFVKLGTGRQS